MTERIKIPIDEWLLDCIDLFEEKDGTVVMESRDLLDIARYISKLRMENEKLKLVREIVKED